MNNALRLMMNSFGAGLCLGIAAPIGGSEISPADLARTYRSLDAREEQLKPFLQWPSARQELDDVRRCKAEIAHKLF